MLLNEIEVTGSSFAFRRINTEVKGVVAVFAQLKARCDAFDLESELPGIHDLEHNDEIIRGFFSVVVPFEVEHLVEGISTKTLLKRIESCEFMLTEKIVIAYGQNDPIKLFMFALSAATGNHVDRAEYDHEILYRLQDRLSKVSSISLLNPKDMSVRKAKLSGTIEHYAEYDVVNRNNHGIDYVQGLIEATPIGPVKIKVTQKGLISLGVRRGTIIPVETLEWIIAFIEEQ